MAGKGRVHKNHGSAGLETTKEIFCSWPCLPGFADPLVTEQPEWLREIEVTTGDAGHFLLDD